MHANTHGAIGIAIITATYVLTKSEKKTFLIGGLLAFASHYVLDFIGEAGYKSVQEMLLIEFGVYVFALVLMGFLGRKFFVFAVFAHILANLMDYIDKKMYLALFLPKEYEITYFFHSRNQVLLPISYNETIAAAFISIAIIVFCFVLLKSKEKILN
jgi:hypothetical protein